MKSWGDTALVEPFVHESAWVDPSAILGPGVWIGPKVTIGPGVRIGAYTVIGSMPEHRSYYDDVLLKTVKGVVVQPDARIFEFVTIHSGTVNATCIGEAAAVFNHAHIAHDCLVGAGGSVGGGSSLAGHTIIMPFAILSGKSCTFQRCVIGAFAFVGGNSFVTHHVPPGEKWMGSPARHAGINEIGLQRAGLTIDTVREKWTEQFNSFKETEIVVSKISRGSPSVGEDEGPDHHGA